MFDKESINIKKELSGGLLRQRRNLILMSLLMPLFFLSGASVNQINMFGTIIHLTNQKGINIAIFVIYVYFLWRYLQYYLEEERAKEFQLLRDNRINQIEFDYLKDLMRKKADCFEFKDYYPSYKEIKMDSFKESRYLSDDKYDKKLGLITRSRVMEIYGLADKYENHYLKNGEDHIELPSKEIEIIEKDWRLVNKQQGDSRSGAVFETDVEYNALYLNWIRFINCFKFYVIHPYFSDYQLPFWISGSSFIITITYLYII